MRWRAARNGYAQVAGELLNEAAAILLYQSTLKTSLSQSFLKVRPMPGRVESLRKSGWTVHPQSHHGEGSCSSAVR
jgi:hypothetical protein